MSKHWTVENIDNKTKLVKFDMDFAVWEDYWYNLPKEEGSIIEKINDNTFKVTQRLHHGAKNV
jgi:hypothetical protein